MIDSLLSVAQRKPAKIAPTIIDVASGLANMKAWTGGQNAETAVKTDSQIVLLFQSGFVSAVLIFKILHAIIK
mgnify:CR=1 FL=1